MKLITELNDTVSCLFEEDKDGKKNYFIEGVFMQGDIKNR
ncbi:MAG: primosomal protein, partial [Thaumarchaeota archaeon]|nr:primosomal protein [Nitrososphaerota archaeon]